MQSAYHQSMILGHPIHRYEEVTSTNLVAADLLRNGATEGTLVVADGQTQGRGRLGREWISPTGVNLYCSYILRAGDAEWISWIPLMASMAVAAAITGATRVNARIKWPNDVLIDGKKVAGVLAETVSPPQSISDAVQFVILGIGVNVNIPVSSLPESLHATTTSLMEHVGDDLDRDQLLTGLTTELDVQYRKYWEGQRLEIVREYLAMSDTIGKKVVAHFPVGSPMEGWADGIELDGSLRLRRGQGGLSTIHSADIVHLR